MCVYLLSHVQLCESMDCSPPGCSVSGIFQLEYWSRLPFPSPGDLSIQGLNLSLLLWIGRQILYYCTT